MRELRPTLFQIFQRPLLSKSSSQSHRIPEQIRWYPFNENARSAYERFVVLESLDCPSVLYALPQRFSS